MYPILNVTNKNAVYIGIIICISMPTSKFNKLYTKHTYFTAHITGLAGSSVRLYFPYGHLNPKQNAQKKSRKPLFRQDQPVRQFLFKRSKVKVTRRQKHTRSFIHHKHGRNRG